MTNVDTEKLGSDRLGSQMKKPQHPRSLACLLYTIEQGGECITYSLARRLTLRYSRTESRAMTVLGVGGEPGRTFSIYTVNFHTWRRRRLYHAPESSPREGFGTSAVETLESAMAMSISAIPTHLGLDCLRRQSISLTTCAFPV